MVEPELIPYYGERYGEQETLDRGKRFCQTMSQRRSVRDFAPDPVPREAIEWAIATASSAPSGANRQPWRFVAVDDPAIRREIRLAAEQEERAFYEGGRISEQWRTALAPLGTDWRKPFLETAPWLVAVFEEVFLVDEHGGVEKNYYVKESVGIACGMFIAAIHQMGLATLTHTPSPMTFLSKILGRPDNERPYILFPVGYPAVDARVPNIRRKTLDEVVVWNRPE